MKTKLVVFLCCTFALAVCGRHDHGMNVLNKKVKELQSQVDDLIQQLGELTNQSDSKILKLEHKIDRLATSEKEDPDSEKDPLYEELDRCFDDRCVKIYKGKISWTGADEFCRSYNMRLVKITDGMFNEFVRESLDAACKKHDTVEKYCFGWIGLKQMDWQTYKWTDGGNITFIRWNRPEDYDIERTYGWDGNDCIYMNRDGRWEDFICHLDVIPYTICEQL